ncbi:MAG: 50S ribosomal protein L15 [Firmicutes bacterium]|nr:50S ribosomal protein L15 [Bacillota bacterium]
MKLHELKPAAGSRTPKRRVGRGIGSGLGKTSTRGHKGQRSRSGHSLQPGFEGGQMPLVRRLPKVGFTSIFKKKYSLVNVNRLDSLPADTIVTPQLMYEEGLVRNRRLPVKILGNGELSKALTVQAHKFSASATEKIENAGGKVEVI